MTDFIEAHRGEYGVEPICEVLPIAPSTYYAHVAKRADPEKLSARAKQDMALKPEIAREAAQSADPVARLPVTLIARNIIEPVFGVTDPRRDKRIDFVGGGRGLGELERLVSSGEMAIAFALYPTAMSDLMAVADAGAIMPPKSTWFEPKLADGMVSHMLD